jgi:formylglycine-generating enzyme required for sulfatase activity
MEGSDPAKTGAAVSGLWTRLLGKCRLACAAVAYGVFLCLACSLLRMAVQDAPVRMVWIPGVEFTMGQRVSTREKEAST